MAECALCKWPIRVETEDEWGDHVIATPEGDVHSRCDLLAQFEAAFAAFVAKIEADGIDSHYAPQLIEEASFWTTSAFEKHRIAAARARRARCSLHCVNQE